MVRQRKSHTRVKKGPAAQAEVLSGDGQPDEGETGEGSSGAWEKVGITGTMGHCQGGPGGEGSLVGPRGWWTQLALGRKQPKSLPQVRWEQHAWCSLRGADISPSVPSDACGPAC